MAIKFTSVAPRAPEAKRTAPKPSATIAKPKTDSAPVDFKRKRGRPLAKDKEKALSALRPWIAEGMSRATWYRRQSLRPGKHSLERPEKAIEGL
jgi:hypothetical protein